MIQKIMITCPKCGEVAIETSHRENGFLIECANPECKEQYVLIEGKLYRRVLEPIDKFEFWNK